MDLIQVLDGVYTGCYDLNIPGKLIDIVSKIILVLKFGVPILLIIFGMLDLGKAVIASKEDEIKKGQQMFIKRLIAAVIVFFVITVVQLIVNLATDNDNGENKNIWDCVDVFIKGVNGCETGTCVKNK